MKLAIDIERLVIDDPALVPGRTERLGPLVAAELQRRLEHEPLETEPRERDRIDMPPLGVVPASDEALARQLADRLVEALRGGGS